MLWGWWGGVGVAFAAPRALCHQPYQPFHDKAKSSWWPLIRYQQ